MRVADVALFYGGRSGGIRTYLDEKATYAAGTGAFEHHLIVPGRQRRSEGRRHELPSVSVAGSNHAFPGPTGLYARGLHPAFRPQPDVSRRDHVLYVGRLGREKGIFELLEAAARSREPWPLELIGAGTAGDAVAAHVERLGLERRVSFRPYLADRRALARAYASARCVVMPGAYETFGLVAFEAAASGASTVACASAPSARLLGRLAHTFAPGEVDGLAAAIERARAAEPDHAAAARLAAEHTWARAFSAELADLETLTRGQTS
jgi:glycosyltransferase involved in cell wall biosynthesis